jgi:prolyl-tRNA editing enzyme YbaK/EbsC (Cys-tRNA(Pro) deacylase)
MSGTLSASAQRVQDFAGTLGLTIAVQERPQSTRTAEEAAAACGCEVGQIVKSLVFEGTVSGAPYLLLVSGKNRVDQDKAEATIGERLTRPDAAKVRAWTGFAIGGIPPFGHTTPMKTFIDPDLLAYDTVWAAAGTPQSIFEIDPKALARAVDAVAVSMH